MEPWWQWMRGEVPEALEVWADGFGSGAEAWPACPSADWLVRALEVAGAPRPMVVRAAARCVRFALPQLPEVPQQVDDAVGTAEAWAEGAVTVDPDAWRARLSDLHQAKPGFGPIEGWQVPMAGGFARTATGYAVDAAIHLLTAAWLPDDADAPAAVGYAGEALGMLAVAHAVEQAGDGGDDDLEAARTRAEAEALARMVEGLPAAVAWLARRP